MRPVSIRLLFVSLPLLVALALRAQDTRTVTEPKIPPACVTLQADVVADHGVIALPDEQKLSTARIQDALDHCAAGHSVAPADGSMSVGSKSVVLQSKGKKNVFLTGPLTLRPGVTLVVSKNTALVASRDPRLYDLSPGACGIVAEHGRGCKPLISGDGAKDAGIMGQGSIDARGGATLLGQNVTWWDLAHQAKVTDQQQSVPAMIALRHVDNFILYKITLRNSPGFHVSVNQTDGFTAWGVKIMTPKTARNTDGIDPGSSRNITIAYSYIHTGDDDVCLKPSGAGPVSNMSVLHNHFYSGHGMSIGSGTFGGVDHLLVDDLTIDGADNGLRIKSDPQPRRPCSSGRLSQRLHPQRAQSARLHAALHHFHRRPPAHLQRHHASKTCTCSRPAPSHFSASMRITSSRSSSTTSSPTIRRTRSSTTRTPTSRSAQASAILSLKATTSPITQAPASTPGQPLACDARFVPFPEDKTAPEMAGKIPPEDKTFYVAADGTGDYYSIQRALDMAPKTGGACLIGLARRLSRSAHYRQAQHHHSQRQS